MKFRNWFWGLFFILAGILVIVNQLGYLTGINIFTLVATIFLIFIIVKSATHLNFGGILFPMAFLGILYAGPLGITNLTPWPILAVALFGTIGFSFIFPHRYRFHQEEHEENFKEIVNDPDEQIVNCNVSFGSMIKYVNTEKLKVANLRCSFGALKVYFDNARIAEGQEAQINLDISFSGVELYIPKEWNIINNVSTSLGGIEEKNKRHENTDCPTVRINGKVSFSGIEIIYV